MAINFLNSVNLNQNELIKARIENQPNNTAAGTGVEGQLYYDTTLDVLKVWANGAWVEVGGGVTTFTASDGTFINLTPNTSQTGAVTLLADLSATGTPDSTVYLRGDNTWSPISAIPGTYSWSLFADSGGINPVSSGTAITIAGGTNVTTSISGSTLTINASNANITLTGEVTGSGTTSISTTVANGVLDVANFNASAIITEAEGIENNDNDTTLPTSAAVKAYVDNAVVGGLVYQGGYNAATNVPNLDSPPTISGIKKGWTYTVTADGLFFTEQVRVGDVLIAQVDSPTTLANWTTVQNNIDLASLSQVGIGNVNAGTGINVSYLNGTATVSTQVTSATGVITAGLLSGTVNHTFGLNTIVQTIDSTGATVFCDVTRTSTSVTATIAAVQASNITILVQKVG
jgi:hypothetical protein